MGYVASDDYWGSQIPRLVNYGLHKRLTVRSVKLFADGALGSWGAALIAPYNDKPDTQGLLRASSQTLQKLAEQFHEDDFQVVGVLSTSCFPSPEPTRQSPTRTSMLSAIAQMRSCLTSLKTS
jgi:hypothetical protein